MWQTFWFAQKESVELRNWRCRSFFDPLSLPLSYRHTVHTPPKKNTLCVSTLWWLWPILAIGVHVLQHQVHIECFFEEANQLKQQTNVFTLYPAKRVLAWNMQRPLLQGSFYCFIIYKILLFSQSPPSLEKDRKVIISDYPFIINRRVSIIEYSTQKSFWVTKWNNSHKHTQTHTFFPNSFINLFLRWLLRSHKYYEIFLFSRCETTPNENILTVETSTNQRTERSKQRQNKNDHQQSRLLHKRSKTRQICKKERKIVRKSADKIRRWMEIKFCAFWWERRTT